MNKLVVYRNWKEFQDVINNIGWENTELYVDWVDEYAKKDKNGHLIMNINPEDENMIYLGYIYGDELSAIGSISIQNDALEICDFEVFKNKRHRGIGRLFFNDILKKFNKGYSIVELTYRDKNARLFWERMGFKGYKNIKLMELNVNENINKILYKMKNLNEYIVEMLNESEDAKIKELEKKLDDVEDKAEDAEEAAEDAEEAADDAEKEAGKAEESIKNEDDFRDYAENKFKKVFGDKVDKDKMNKVIDGILDEYADEAKAGDWGTIVGVLNKSF